MSRVTTKCKQNLRGLSCVWGTSVPSVTHSGSGPFFQVYNSNRSLKFPIWVDVHYPPIG